MVNMKDYLNAISLLPERYKEPLSSIPESAGSKINEIRFRSGGALTLETVKESFYITKNGRLTVSYGDSLVTADSRDMQDIVFSLSRRSVHTYQDMIAKGFIPLHNGCKAGVVGCAVLREGAVSSVSAFNSVNIRVAREVYGCSENVLASVGECRSFLLVGPPLSGKTTILRDICRMLSGGGNLHPVKTAVIDERDEIASRAFSNGNDVGVHTDVLSLYPKPAGMETALRMLSPDIIVLDEIGSEAEADAMLAAMNSGVGFIATAHGGSVDEVMRRPQIKRLTDSGVFGAVVVLEGRSAPGKVREMVRLA